MPPTSGFAMLVWCLLEAHAASHGGCRDCMEHEQNVLMQLANLQPDLDSNQDHSPRFRRFRRLRRRFRGYRRYGGKTTTRAPTTTTEDSTTTEATTASTTTTGPTSTTTTRVVCEGNTDVQLVLAGLNPPQNEFTLESPETSSNCQCVGKPFLVSIQSTVPGWLEVVVAGVGDPKNVSLISITSPNSTEVRVTPLTSGSDALLAGNVLFNGFQGVGNWSIRLLNADGSPSSQTGTFVLLQFGFVACSQIPQVPDCVGNAFGGRQWAAQNFSLVGTNLSTSPSLLQFDAGASSSCCVPAFNNSQFSDPQNNIRLQLGFTTAATGTVNAEGLSPSGIPFNLTGNIVVGGVIALLTPGFVGSPAAGQWNLSTSMESGSAVITDTFTDPTLNLRVEPCS